MGHSTAVLTLDAKAPAAARGYVLHVVPANGGGVDRYVRDICAHRPQDCILHVVPEQCVFEGVDARRFMPIAHNRMADSTVIAALGRPLLLHAHSTLAPVREQVALLSRALGVEYALTLHDIDFASVSDEVDHAERKARLDFVRKAAQRAVPSAFISELLSTAVGALVSRQLIENGVDAAVTGGEPGGRAGVSGAFELAVVGALGTHKGLNFLHQVVAALPLEVRVVIIGYADGQLTAGWLKNNRLWVHGAFEPCELAGLLADYGARIALFPNRQPESYSYALSDVWLSGLPALGPAAGAIGERIAQTGAGWTYAAESTPEMVAAKLLHCISAAYSVAGCVKNAAASLPSTRVMAEQLDQFYEKIMRTPDIHDADASNSPQIKTLEAIAETHLNGHFFRGELSKLSGDLAFSQTQAANSDLALQAVTLEYDARGEWIATLEASLSECKAELARIELARVTENQQMEAARRIEREQADAARTHERALSEAAREAAREADRKRFEAARKADRERFETARQTDHELFEAARNADRELFEVARNADRELFEGVRAAEREVLESARQTERELFEATRQTDRAVFEAASNATREAFAAARLADCDQSDAARAKELALQRGEAEAARVQAHAAHEKYAAKLQQDVVDTLVIAHQQQSTIAVYESALSMIPPFVRRPMLARAERSISMKVAQ